MKCKNVIISCLILMMNSHFVNGQGNREFLLTKGENNISIITTESVRSTQCTVFEYPDFLVVYEIPRVIQGAPEPGTTEGVEKKEHPLIAFIDSVYSNKPIKYVLNSHHHSHSLYTVIPFLERGAMLVTEQQNIDIYKKRGLFDNAAGKDYSASIICVSSDTTLLSDSDNPIEILHLKKSDYKSMPTDGFLFFYFPRQELLAASCMVHLQEFDDDYGFKGVVYNDRLTDAAQIIQDKNLQVKKTLQLFRLRIKGGERKPPIYDISYMHNVLKDGWHRSDLSEHLQGLSIETLTTKQDSLLKYLGKNEIYYTVLNQAVYGCIEKKQYQKAVALAHLLIIYKPNNLDEIDTLGEAYYNNGEIAMAQHYDRILQSSQGNKEGLGFAMWEDSRKERLKKG